MNEIFISYSKNDTKLTDLIRNDHLKEYPTWSMSDINVGQNYIEAIENKLKDCDSAILILSPYFFNSDFIMTKELPALLERNKDPDFKLMSILLNKCEKKDLDKLGPIQIFPSPSRPLTVDGKDWNHYFDRFRTEQLNHLTIEPNVAKNVLWDELKQQLEQDVRVPNPMRGSRNLILYSDPSKKLELYIPINGEDCDVELKIRAIKTRIETLDRIDYFVLSISNSELFEYFYAFSTYIDDEFTTSDSGLESSIKSTTKKWKELTKEELSRDDIEKGLLGELWVLDKLIEVLGSEAIQDWRGSDGDRHDFRFGNKELEVKTTSSSERTHYISSINQLEPSVDCLLTLISLQISPTRAKTKNLTVKKLKTKISKRINSPDYQTLFNLKLQDYVNDHVSLVDTMNTSYVFASDPMAIDVDESFPKISNEEYTALEAHTRISDLKYRLNVDGLGVKCDTFDYWKLFKG